MRTIREQELMLAAALDAVYHTLQSARVRAYDLMTADVGHLGGVLWSDGAARPLVEDES